MNGQVNNYFKNKMFISFPAIIVCVALLSYIRIYLLQNTFGDDNCCLLSFYSTNNLTEFLNTGFNQIRRIPQGIVLYDLFWFHKNTDYFYIILHSINLCTQTLTPLIFFFFLRNLFKDDLLAFFVAITSLIYPLDTTIPFAVHTLYRAGALCCISSFYFMEKALAKDKINWAFLFLALMLGCISYSVFVEGAVFLEPARFFVSGLIFYNKGFRFKQLIIKSIIYFLPFILIALPLILYKSIFKAYGVYAGAYDMNLTFLLSWSLYAPTFHHFIFSRWSNFFYWFLQKEALLACLPHAILSSMLVFYLFYRMGVTGKTGKTRLDKKDILSPEELTPGIWKNFIIILFLGIMFFIPPLLVYQAIGKSVHNFFDSRNGVVMQFGYDLIVGGVLYALFIVFNALTLKKCAAAFISLIIGCGVFYNNWDLDVYFVSSQKQQQFWKKFVNRFPVLPEKAAILYDIQIVVNHLGQTQFNQYSFELALNMLYAKSSKAEDFHHYIGASVKNLKDNKIDKVFDESRFPGHGHKYDDSEELIIVYYDDQAENELFVNREILKKRPDFSYQAMPVKDFRGPAKHVVYPLRYKLKGFS